MMAYSKPITSIGNKLQAEKAYIQRPMRSDVVVIARVESQDSAQMGLAENDDMIQALELTLARPQQNHARLLRLKPKRRHSCPVRRLNIHISAWGNAGKRPVRRGGECPEPPKDLTSHAREAWQHEKAGLAQSIRPVSDKPANGRGAREMSTVKQQEFEDAIERALEAKGLDPNPKGLPSLEHFETAMEVAATFGLVFDTGMRSPDGKIIWARGRRQ